MGNVGTPESKLRAFAQAGIPVADTIDEIVALVKKALAKAAFQGPRLAWASLGRFHARPVPSAMALSLAPCSGVSSPGRSRQAQFPEGLPG